jgi:hypothetical protein
MSCDCCDNPKCLSRPPRNLSIEIQGSTGALLTWQPPDLDAEHEPLEGYDLFVKRTDGTEIFSTNLGADETEYDFEGQYFLQDDQEFIVVLEALYNSCFNATAQITSVLRSCLEKSFNAVHVNATAFTDSDFIISSVAEVPRNGELEYLTGCDGSVVLRLQIPCSDKMKGTLTENGVEILSIRYGTQPCEIEYEYTPSVDGAVIKWEIILDIDCQFGEPVLRNCSYGSYTLTQLITGCMDPLAFNYNPSANVPGACVPKVFGCTNPAAINYDPAANTDNGTCVMPVLGCTDPNSINYNPSANVNDGSCIAKVLGCTNPASVNYNPAANTDDGSCVAKVMGCTDPNSINYNPAANTNDGSCVPRIFGCTDPTAMNYDPAANTNNGTCVYQIPGCTNPSAKNYNPFATVDDESCEFPVCNYGTADILLDEETLIVDNFTEINIFFDASGSMNTTLPPLQQMKEQFLKACLLPFYNGDENLYNSRVKVIGGSGNPNGNWTNERTFSGLISGQGPILQRLGSSSEITKVINLVFQDEAQIIYHASNTTFDADVDTPTSGYISDLTGFKNLLATKSNDYYRGVIFQVQGFPMFKKFLEAIENGQGNFASHSLTDISDRVKIKYDVIEGNPDPKYYANLITEALNQMGFNVPTC